MGRRSRSRAGQPRPRECAKTSAGVSPMKRRAEALLSQLLIEVDQRRALQQQLRSWRRFGTLSRPNPEESFVEACHHQEQRKTTLHSIIGAYNNTISFDGKLFEQECAQIEKRFVPRDDSRVLDADPIEAEPDSAPCQTSSLTTMPSDDRATSTNPVTTGNDESSTETTADKATFTSPDTVVKKTSVYKAAYIAALEQVNTTPKPTVLAREQSCLYKARYESALAKANAAPSLLHGKILVSGKVSTQVKLLEQKAASRSSTDKPIARLCVKQNLPATSKSSPRLSTASKKEEPTTATKHPTTSDITHVREPIAIGRPKASYLAALAKASTASITQAAVCGKASSSVGGKISALVERFEDKTETSTWPGTSRLQHSSSMVFTAFLKEELTATEPSEITEVNGPKVKVPLRQQSSCYKASYEAALAKANASSSTPVCEMASFSRRASDLTKLYEEKAKSTRPSVKMGQPTSQIFTAKLSTSSKEA